MSPNKNLSPVKSDSPFHVSMKKLSNQDLEKVIKALGSKEKIDCHKEFEKMRQLGKNCHLLFFKDAEGARHAKFF